MRIHCESRFQHGLDTQKPQPPPRGATRRTAAAAERERERETDKQSTQDSTVAPREALRALALRSRAGAAAVTRARRREHARPGVEGDDAQKPRAMTTGRARGGRRSCRSGQRLTSRRRSTRRRARVVLCERLRSDARKGVVSAVARGTHASDCAARERAAAGRRGARIACTCLDIEGSRRTRRRSRCPPYLPLRSSV